MTRSSSWLPVAILGLATVVVLATYGTPIWQIAVFGLYIVLGIALPGMLWVRMLRGRVTHLSEDIALGLAIGYCVEIAAYVTARAIGVPLLFLLWPVLTFVAFVVVPCLRQYWRGSGDRAPGWWSWSLALLLGYVLAYSAGTFFAQHQLTGTDTPYVDMPYHLSLIGELRHHVPPSIPYVSGVPLAYHWFFYAEAAATSWATGIEPLTLLYRLSGLPYFAAFVVLTAHAARRFTGGWWTGPVAVAIALFGVVAAPYAWAAAPVFHTQTLGATWISPTNLFGLVLFAAVIVVLMDLLQSDGRLGRGQWLLLAALVGGIAGAKASLVPMLIAGLVVVIGGVAISRRQLLRPAAAALLMAIITFAIAAIVLFRGTTGGLVIGLDSLHSLPVVALTGGGHAVSTRGVVLAVAGLLAALVLWSFLWAGAYGLLVRRTGSIADPRILLLLGICASALGAVIVFSYPGLSQLYYLRGAAGAFGLLTAAGIAAILPARARDLAVIGAAVTMAIVGAGAVLIVRAVGPAEAPSMADEGLRGVMVAILLPILALVGVVAVSYVLITRLARQRSGLRGSTGILLVALMIGFSLPSVAVLLASPVAVPRQSLEAIPAEAIATARWLRDNSAPSDLVATNLHCLPQPATSTACDARHFWMSAYTERRALVEGWAYTAPAIAYAIEQGVSDRTVPFWDQAVLAANDQAFAAPSGPALATLRDTYGVRWLFADMTHGASEALGEIADLRHRDGPFAVYELRRP